MATVPKQHQRVLSGMRPTGMLHLGHLHGVLKNWIRLQHEYECFFFVADWHALTTHYDEPEIIDAHVWDMVIDWLAAGINPGDATLFVQSKIPEHAELHLLLSMITPLGWLERVPSYKDQQENLRERDLATYGFLGYPAAAKCGYPGLQSWLGSGWRRPSGAYRAHSRDSASFSILCMDVKPDSKKRSMRRFVRWGKRTQGYTVS